MADNSKIEWTDASWSPIRARYFEIQNDGSGKERIGWHCEHVSEGCRNCYAEAMNRRLGTGLDFKPGELYREEKRGFHNGEAKLFLDQDMLTQPLRWKKPRMIFVCSMTDLFADFVPDEWIDQIFAVMALCPQHTFQVLTKRAQRMRQWFGTDRADSVGLAMLTIVDRIPYGHRRVPWPLPNVWIGVSTERQQEADERIPLLLQTPAAVRFISAEPLLGPIELTRSIYHGEAGISMQGFLRDKSEPDDFKFHAAKLDWVIAGGESGREARPMHPDWARSLRDQCKAAAVPYFFKQWGEWIPGAQAAHLSDGDLAQFKVVDLVSNDRGNYCFRVGKSRAGRLLDGVEYNAMPSRGAA